MLPNTGGARSRRRLPSRPWSARRASTSSRSRTTMPRARDGNLVEHRRALRDQRRPIGEFGIGVARRHQLPVRRVAIGAEVHAVLAEDRVGLELVACVDRPRLGGRGDRPDPDRVRPEIAGLEHRDRRVLGLVDLAPVLRVVHLDQQLVGRPVRAELVPIAAMRLLARVRLRRCAARRTQTPRRAPSRTSAGR